MLKALNASLDDLAERTGDDRDRTVDFLRAASIVVVCLWHWTLSVTHRTDDGVLTMPNPIAEVPLGWLATWVLQVMPVFFIVGGFVNLQAWRSDRERGGWRLFFSRRLRRLMVPVAAFVGISIAVDATLVVGFGTRSVIEYGDVVFIPLWFIAAYLWVVVLVPLTASAHLRWGVSALAVLAVAVAAADLARFGLGLEQFGWVNTALVWVLIHQLGYFYGSDSVLRWSAARRVAVAVVGFAGLGVLTTLDRYPRSLVAHAETDLSHMYPTTAVVGLVALAQFGLMLTARPVLSRWLERRGPWKAVIAVNTTIMTVFLWHMVALLVTIVGYEALGFELMSEPTRQWWIQRPLWIIAPLIVLGALVALFSRFERAGRGTSPVAG